MFDKLRKFGVVPWLLTMLQWLALCEALLPMDCRAEITFRTEAAADDPSRQSFPELLLGAGTVLTADQVDRAIQAGARFAVAPGCNPVVVRAAQRQGLPFAPGVCTPSDVERALEIKCKMLKFFPAEASGGVPMLKALIGPYGHTGIGFCPTGGVTIANMKDYLALPQVAFVGGTWIAKSDLVKKGDWEGIGELARQAVEAARR